MLADDLRIILIVLLSITMMSICVLTVLEIIQHATNSFPTLLSILLLLTQLSLNIVLYATKNIKILLITLIVNTVIIILVFVGQNIILSQFIDKMRENFQELIIKYPYNQVPNEFQLAIAHSLIKEQKCCGIDVSDMTMPNVNWVEREYFNFFPNNCNWIQSVKVSQRDIFQ